MPVETLDEVQCRIFRKAVFSNTDEVTLVEKLHKHRHSYAIVWIQDRTSS
jgi:hypothetical protein